MEVSRELFFILLGISMIFNIIFINFLEKRLRSPIKYQIISFLVSLIPVYFIETKTLESILFINVFFILLIYSFIDIKFFELSNKHYILLIIYSILSFVLSFFSDTYILHLLSVFAVYVTFFIFDKFVGIEKLGGADVKVMLILSLYFEATDVLFFTLITFVVSMLIFILERIVRKTFCDLQVPMIISIAVAFFISMYSYFCNF